MRARPQQEPQERTFRRKTELWEDVRWREVEGGTLTSLKSKREIFNKLLDGKSVSRYSNQERYSLLQAEGNMLIVTVLHSPRTARGLRRIWASGNTKHPLPFRDLQKDATKRSEAVACRSIRFMVMQYFYHPFGARTSDELYPLQSFGGSEVQNANMLMFYAWFWPDTWLQSEAFSIKLRWDSLRARS